VTVCIVSVVGLLKGCFIGVKSHYSVRSLTYCFYKFNTWHVLRTEGCLLLNISKDIEG
jgi:hypothetical protein